MNGGRVMMEWWKNGEEWCSGGGLVENDIRRVKK